MKNENDKTAFKEWSSAQKGQHFITVSQYVDGKEKFIARIFRSYDAENKKANYIARDWQGTQIFSDTNDLPTLKKLFIKHGKTLAMTIPETEKDKKDKEFKEIELAHHEDGINENPGREEELKQIRERNTEKEKEKEMDKGIER